MYRDAPKGFAPTDPMMVVPGFGLREVLVGGATPERVLIVFGRDARVFLNPDVTEISYDHDARSEYLPRRPGSASTPAKFHFVYGLLSGIEISVYQDELYTEGGIRIRSSREDVLAAFGPDFQRIEYETMETLRYIGRGIQFNISTDDDFGVSSFIIFREQRTNE